MGNIIFWVLVIILFVGFSLIAKDIIHSRILYRNKFVGFISDITVVVVCLIYTYIGLLKCLHNWFYK